MAKSGTSPTPAWHRLAQPTERLRGLWIRGNDRTRWEPCGHAWDAMAITPMSLGLDALVAMHLRPATGYAVLADHLSNQLYVLVAPAPGTGMAAAGVPGVRVLSRGAYVLVPMTDHGVAAAHWISPPCESPLRLVRADRFTSHLRALTDVTHERTVLS